MIVGVYTLYTSSQNEGSFCPIPRHGAVSSIIVPEKKKYVHVVGMGCGRLASEPEYKSRQVGARARFFRGPP